MALARRAALRASWGLPGPVAGAFKQKHPIERLGLMLCSSPKGPSDHPCICSCQGASFVGLFNKTSVHLALLLLVGGLLFLPDLGRQASIDGREAVHAEIAREMAETGSYAVPYVCGRQYIDKPPLFNWVVALLFRLTGRVDFTVARLPSAAAALAAMLATYAMGRRWASARAGLWAALILGTSWLVIEWARTARMDMMMASLIMCAILLADCSASSGKPWASGALWCAASAVIAGAVMSKGPQSLLFFAVAAVPLWRARRRRWMPPVPYMLVTLAVVSSVVVAWVAVAEAHAPGHLRALVNYQFGTGLIEHPKRVYLYIDQILFRTAPWGIFSVLAAYHAARTLKSEGCTTRAIPAVVLTVCLTAMTILPNKRAHYLLPILPMWAIFLGGSIETALSHTDADHGGTTGSTRQTRLLRWAFDWPLRITLLLLVVAMGAALVAWPLLARSGWRLAIAAALAVAAIAVWGCVAAWRGRKTTAVVGLFAAVSALAIAAYPLATRFCLEPYPREPVLEISRAIPPGVPVAGYGVDFPLLYFTLDRPVVFALDQDRLREFARTPGRRYVITTPENVALVKELAGERTREVGTWQIRNSKPPGVIVLELSP